MIQSARNDGGDALAKPCWQVQRDIAPEMKKHALYLEERKTVLILTDVHEVVACPCLLPGQDGMHVPHVNFLDISNTASSRKSNCVPPSFKMTATMAREVRMKKIDQASLSLATSACQYSPVADGMNYPGVA